MRNDPRVRGQALHDAPRRGSEGIGDEGGGRLLHPEPSADDLPQLVEALEAMPPYGR